MKIISLQLLILFLLASSVFAGGIKTQEQTSGDNLIVDKWNIAEIKLTSTKKYVNPFNEVEVIAIFTGPDNQIIHRPAFWDGGNTWKIRFAPTVTGIWKMKTICSDNSNKGLGNITQLITCKPYTGNLDIYKHGFLKVSDSKRYFIYNDGTPFFYLGDTHWLYIHERFNSSNVKGIASEFKYIVDKRVAQGFTVYQTEAIQHPHGQNSKAGGGKHNGKDEEAYCNFRNGFDENDIAGFKNIDRKFAYIADKGLVNANSSICWGLDPAEYPDVYTVAYMAKLGKYWSAATRRCCSSTRKASR